MKIVNVYEPAIKSISVFIVKKKLRADLREGSRGAIPTPPPSFPFTSLEIYYEKNTVRNVSGEQMRFPATFSKISGTALEGKSVEVSAEVFVNSLNVVYV